MTVICAKGTGGRVSLYPNSERWAAVSPTRERVNAPGPSHSPADGRQRATIMECI